MADNPTFGDGREERLINLLAVPGMPARSTIPLVADPLLDASNDGDASFERSVVAGPLLGTSALADTPQFSVGSTENAGSAKPGQAGNDTTVVSATSTQPGGSAVLGVPGLTDPLTGLSPIVANPPSRSISGDANDGPPSQIVADPPRGIPISSDAPTGSSGTSAPVLGSHVANSPGSSAVLSTTPVATSDGSGSDTTVPSALGTTAVVPGSAPFAFVPLPDYGPIGSDGAPPLPLAMQTAFADWANALDTYRPSSGIDLPGTAADVLGAANLAAPAQAPGL